MPSSHLRKLVVFGLGLALIGLGPSVAADAQAAYRLNIQYPEVAEGASSLSLGLYFTVEDAGGQVLSDAEVTQAEVRMDDGAVYSAAVAKPSSEAYIVLVLDASGSMVGSMNQLRQAAVQAVQSAPEEASFAVVQFASRVNRLQDFTTDKAKIEEAINKIRAVSGGGTCLYDAAYNALELLEGAPRGRRGIILFTDGDDELANGRPCSQHTFEEVVSLAANPQARVPIHTIGLRTSSTSAVNEALLKEMADLTGGTAQTGESSSLSLLFTSIIRSLSFQWLATAEIYPQAGENPVTLTVWLKDGPSVTSEPVVITSSQDYVAPPSVRVESLTYTNTGNANLHLQLTKPEQIAALEVQVVDTESNVAAPPFRVNPAEIVQIPASAFKSGNAYRLSLRSLDAGGNLLWESFYAFTYDPTIVEGAFEILAVELDSQTPAFLITISSQNLEDVDHYEIWLNDTSKKTVVPGSRASLPAETNVALPLSAVPGGTYDIVATAVSSDGVVLAQADYPDAVYRVSLGTRIARAARAYIWIPLCLGLVFLISGAVLVKVLVLDPRKQKATGVLVESTVVRRGGGLEALDDWSEDRMRLNKRRLQSESADFQEKGPGRGVPPGAARTPPPGAGPSPAAAPPRAAFPPARLTIVQAPEGQARGRSYMLNASPFTIGRAGSNLDLPFAGISRTHATITFRDGRFVLRDDGATNGTTVNEQPVTGKGDIPLESGSSIGLGQGTTLRFDLQ